MGVGLGFLPSNVTTPLRVAVALFAEAAGLAFTTGWLDMQSTTIKVDRTVRFFVVIRTNFLPLEPGI
jgi:hypothetical protein